MSRTLPCLALLLAAAPSVALAVPAQLTTQGRVLDADGQPLADTADVTFRLMDTETGGNTLWEETQTVAFSSGFYTVMLGTDEVSNPLEDGILDQWPLYLEVQLDGQDPMSPRMAVGSVPYARQAGVATELAPGAEIDAGSLTVGGTEVVASDGTWTGPSPVAAWSDLTGVPADFADEDDADTLADTTCGDGEVLIHDASGGGWVCGTDATLSSVEVQALVEAISGLALAAGVTVGGSPVLTEASHGTDPDAHHSSTSDGIDITPASVVIQGTSTSLTDGSIDLGSSADDALSASMVQTLTGGGSADALHSHAAASGGGGGCYTSIGTSSCTTGYTQAYSGFMISPNVTYIPLACIASAAFSGTGGNSAGSLQGYTLSGSGVRVITHILAGPLECAMCCPS